jgi:Flp pilus assembly protein TadD
METAESLNESAIALTGANRPDEAIPLFRKALRLEPHNPLLWTNLGIAQQRSGDYDEALTSFYHAISFEESLPDPWFSLGLIYYEMKEFALAEDCYRNALDRDDANPKTWNNLGALYFVEGSYEDARTCFEEAVSIMPLYQEALFNLVDACRALGDWRAAGEYARSLSELESRGRM